MSKKAENIAYGIFWTVVVVGLFVGLCLMIIKSSEASDLRKKETGYCVAIGGERITDGKCQVGDKIVVITGLDK
jgi:hypothetical protein